MKDKIWRKFYECSCHAEGIMAGYEDVDDGMAFMDLAFFHNGQYYFDWKQRIRLCWRVLRRGYPYMDMVMLSQSTAKELAKDLMEFANKDFNFGDKEANKEKVKKLVDQVCKNMGKTNENNS